MKRLVSIFLILMLIVSTSAIDVFAAKNGKYKVWVATSTVKVMKEQKAPMGSQAAMKISMARNEYESGQVIITAGDSPIENADIKVTNLVCGEWTIPQSHISLYIQHYMHITEPTAEYFEEGWYPDALIPLKSYLKENKTLRVEAGKNQGILVKFKTNKNTKPGTYKGKIRIDADGAVREIPVELKVWNFSLTDASHSESAFANWTGDMILAGHPGIEVNSEKYWKLIENYYSFLLDYRISPTFLPVPDDDIKQFVKKAAKYIKDPRVAAYNIPYRKGDFDNGRAKELVNALKSAKLLDKAYYYLGGEIDEPSPAMYQRVKEFCEKIKAIDPKLRHIVTTNINNEFFGYVNTFCSPLTPFDSKDYLKLVSERRAAGDNIWWYGCVAPKYPYPSYHMDDYLMGARLLSWMQKSYGVQGNLYWATDIYMKYDGQKYIPRDIWNDPKAFPGANGDGFLLYPGAEYGIDGPIATMRLETIRDGNEDYEYIWTLEQKVKAAASELRVNVKTEDIMKSVYARLFRNIKSYSKDCTDLGGARDEIAGMIECLDRNPKALVLIGDNVENQPEKEVVIYAEKGTRVKVNGTSIEADSTVGKADKFITTVPYKMGLNQFTVVYEKGGASCTLTRQFVERQPEPKLYPQEINYFESQEAVGKFKGQDGVTLSISNEHAIQGTHSMKVLIPPTGSDKFPGFMTDIAEPLQNIIGYKTLELDVYNEGKSTVDFFAKLFNSKGQAYDVKVGALINDSVTHVVLPLDTVPASFDKTCLSSILFWTWGGSANPISLFVDNLCFMKPEGADVWLGKVKNVNNSPAIDGKLDEVSWELKNEAAIKEGTTDNQAKFGLSWNENYLYAAFDITDESVLNTGAASPWEDDSVEIFIDGDLVRGDYNDHTVRYTIRFDDPNVYALGMLNSKTQGIVQKSVKTDRGYSVEIAIPWKTIGIPAGEAAGRYIGITAHVNDKDTNDPAAKPQGMLAYTKNPSADSDTSANWGVFEISDEVIGNTVTIEEISENNIVIDGVPNEASWKVNQPVSYLAYGSTSNTALFGALWNNKYLYIAFDVTDNDVQAPGAQNPWEDDAVEVFIDGDMARGNYNSHTVQYIIRYSDNTVFTYGNPAAKTDGIIQKSVKTDKGYSFEIAIPWSAFGMNVEAGKSIGFTVHVDDADRAAGSSYGVIAYTKDPLSDAANSKCWAEFVLKPGTYVK